MRRLVLATLLAAAAPAAESPTTSPAVAAAADSLPTEVAAALGALSGEDRQAARRAVGRFAAMGERARPAVPALVAMLDRDRVWAELSDRSEPFTPGMRACRALSAIGAPAVPALAAAVRHPDATRRANAVLVLDEIRTDATLAPLAEAVADKDDALVRRLAAEALGRHPEREGARRALLGALGDSAAPVRKWAAWGLMSERATASPLRLARDRREAGAAPEAGGAAGAEVIAALAPLLRDGSPEVRYAAADAVGSYRRPECVDPLLGALGDGDPEVRGRVVGALGEVGNRRATAPLLALLGDDAADEALLTRLCEALGALQDPLAARPLADLVPKRPERGAADPAARALGRIGDRGAVPALIGALDGRDPGPGAAAEALGTLRDDRAVEPLIRVLRGATGGRRVHAAEALGALNDPRAIGPLAEAVFADAGPRTLTGPRHNLRTATRDARPPGRATAQELHFPSFSPLLTGGTFVSRGVRVSALSVARWASPVTEVIMPE